MKALDNRFYVKFMQLEIGLLVDIEVLIGFMETRYKTNKMNEKHSQTEHLLCFVKLVAKQTKEKMIVDVIKEST